MAIWARCRNIGFACPLLAQIADELRAVFPSVIGDHALRFLWGFKYDSRLSGIPMHADQAAVNVNFWIAPEDANRDPESGGLKIWPVKPPPDWEFDRYNKDEAAIRAFLAAKREPNPMVIPIAPTGRWCSIPICFTKPTGSISPTAISTAASTSPCCTGGAHFMVADGGSAWRRLWRSRRYQRP